MLEPNKLIKLVDTLDAKAEEAFEKLADIDVTSEDYTRTLNNGIQSINFSASIKSTLEVAFKQAKKQSSEEDEEHIKVGGTN